MCNCAIFYRWMIMLNGFRIKRGARGLHWMSPLSTVVQYFWYNSNLCRSNSLMLQPLKWGGAWVGSQPEWERVSEFKRKITLVDVNMVSVWDPHGRLLSLLHSGWEWLSEFIAVNCFEISMGEESRCQTLLFTLRNCIRKILESDGFP